MVSKEELYRRRQVWQEKYFRARKNFLREMRDGCNECRGAERKHGRGSFCEDHSLEADQVILHARDHAGFQAYLQELGIIKKKVGG